MFGVAGLLVLTYPVQGLWGGIANLLSRAERFASQSILPALFALPALVGLASFASAEDRALKLFFTHTGERATITYKRDGKFDPKGLAQINRFLRDWRRNEPTRMDPRLLDLVWEVYKRSGGKDYIHIVSAYRSPATNNMLRNRSRSTGVAKKSQHMLGKAMDFYVPGVKLATLRATAMQMQVGGVGYYPTSGSPFVHLDVGNVRAWPRMSRQELARIFPNGQTMHLPADGRPLPGYNQAVANARKRGGAAWIEIAGSAGDDEEVGSSTRPGGETADNRLVTALLPAPKSRALNALALQTGAAERDDKGSAPELSSLPVPIPAMRPVAPARDADADATLVTASIGPIAALAERPAPVLPAHARFAPLVAREGSKQGADMIASLPMTASWEEENFLQSTSEAALMKWALHSPGEAFDLSAPRLSPRTVHRRVDVAASGKEIVPVAAAELFDASRFASPPEG
ncbi:peptidase M15 family protein [Rhizobium sp. CIAT894]|nr:peptidase M15 family protein [Rhizobium sp. CIAT894]